MQNVNGLRIIDVTLRDGGLVNGFHFDDGFVRALYMANAAAGVDYMEFGYRASRRLFDSKDFGKWKFSSDEDIWALIGTKHPTMKISVMADVGRTDFRDDIRPSTCSPVDAFRIATNIETILEALDMVEYVCSLGYECTCNIMEISRCTDKQIENALKLQVKTPVKAVYFADSFGSLLPHKVREISKMFSDILVSESKLTGFHGHNNLQCASANTIEAMECGASMIDCSVQGFGRGAGNCCLEMMLGYLRKGKYHIEPILSFIREWMALLKKDGLNWGYNINYLLTGLAGKHPKTAISATKDMDDDYLAQWKALIE